MMQTKIRKIIHIDMDAFYASIEQRDNPALRGKPIAVGGSEKRGVVTTASYEARKFSVRSAMPGFAAKQKCPQLIFVKPRFNVYRDVSKQIMNILREYTDLVEPMSLDEAYLDVTENKKGIKSATIIAKEVKQKIKDELHLTASAGISINKFLAKVASDMNKPDGLFVITPEKADEFISKLPIEKVPGIGTVTTRKMKEMGINTCNDLKKYSRVQLVQIFGKTGGYYYDIIHCEYDNPVTPHRIRKSVGSEITFSEDLTDESKMLSEIEKLTQSVVDWLVKKNIKGKTITLKIKYHDFVSRTRSRTIQHHTNSFADIYSTVKDLFNNPHIPEKPVRLLGVSVSNLDIVDEMEEAGQMTLKL